MAAGKDSHQETDTEVIENYRYLFFLELQKQYILESQLLWNKEKSDEKLILVYENALALIMKWKKEYNELFISAFREYNLIKNEKRKNIISNLRKPVIFQILRPVFFNIFKFHITGLHFYQNQLRNTRPVFNRLEESQYFALRNFLLFLIKDMDNGPAVFG